VDTINTLYDASVQPGRTLTLDMLLSRAALIVEADDPVRLHG